MKRILCIHGIGGKDATLASWSREWKAAIREKCGGMPIQFQFLKTDDLFLESRYRMNGIQYLQALRLYLSSWMMAAREKRLRDKDFLDAVRLYAGMPAQFITDGQLRLQLRDRLEKTITHFRPAVLFAHSMGTLVAYDLLRRMRRHEPLVLITSGTQLGHPAMYDLYGGPLQPLPVRRWINLYNKHDRLFASRPLRIRSDHFSEEETPFSYGSLNHDALHYIAVSQRAWKYVTAAGSEAPRAASLRNSA